MNAQVTVVIEQGETHLIPVPGTPNTYMDAIALLRGELDLHAFREGQTYEEYIAEREAAILREIMGLPPGRDMPTDEEIAAGPVQERRQVAKSLIVERLYKAGKLPAARAALDSNLYARERWYAPDKPFVYADDKETLQLLEAIGADPIKILAPPD